MNEVLLTDYAAVRHILTSPSIAARTAPYVGADDFNWLGLLSEAETMSTGEAVLMRIAHDLWHANGVVSVWELARRLDGRAFERVVDALYICRGELESRTGTLPVAAGTGRGQLQPDATGPAEGVRRAVGQPQLCCVGLKSDAARGRMISSG